MSENKVHKKQNKQLVKELEIIEDCHKRKAIKKELRKHKYMHTLQIIRFLNKSRGYFNKDSYDSVIGAFALYVLKENKIIS